jgi:undecaprenyl diphosphate synthase
MSLLKKTLKSELADLHKQEIRLKTIGRRDRLPSDLMTLVDKAVELTQDNDRLTLVMALDYGGRDDILAAVRSVASQVQAGHLDPKDITEDLFSGSLYTAGIPDPDLFIRTSNVLRLSNFLVWQTAYTELVFLKTYWPDFSKDDLYQAVKQFQGCERKFGRATLSD